MDGGIWGDRGTQSQNRELRAHPLALPRHRMEELGLHPADCQVYFGQLLGMCDQISFPLGKLGLPGGWGGNTRVVTHHLCLCMQAKRASPCTSMCPTAL